MSFILTAALILAAAAPAHAAPPGSPPPDQQFESLGHAVEAGVVQPQLAERLYKGETVQTFAVFDAPDAIKAYGNGNPEAVKRATQIFGELQTSIIKDLDLPVEQRFSLLPVLLTPLFDEEAALRLINHRLVASLWIDGLNELWLAQSLPLIGRPMAAAGGLDGAGAAVAILDTGADPAIPALSDITVSIDTAPNDNSPDDNGHGSIVAAIVKGVAPKAKIIPIDVMDGKDIHDRHVFGGINWVLGNRWQHSIRAVNISFGKDEYNLGNCGTAASPYHGSFQMLRQAGTLPIVAAGNHASKSGSFRQGVSLPACVPGAIAVGGSYSSSFTTDQAATGCTDKAPVMVDSPVCSSASGPRLNIMAPGNMVTAGAGLGASGTSMAAPHVSGTVAILASINPFATAPDLQAQLLSSSVQTFDPRTGLTHPRLNLPDAIRAAAPVPNDNRATPRVLPMFSGQLTQTTWAATKEPGEADIRMNSGGASVWFRWQPDRDATVEFSTFGSSFNTLLAVYRVDNGVSTLLADNDDVGSGFTSEVTVPVRAGETIEITADGTRFMGNAFAQSGRLKLTWNLPNDNLADANYVARFSSVNGSNIGATKQGNEPRHCGDTFSRASVWYKYEPGQDLPSVQLEASGSSMMCVAVYRAPANMMAPTFSDLVYVKAGADDQGSPVDFTFATLATDAYYIAVDGVSFESACYPNGMCDYVTTQGAFALQLS